MTVEEVEAVRKVDMVYAHLVRAATGLTPEIHEEASGTEVNPVVVSPRSTRKAWQGIKRAYPGPGGYKEFLTQVAYLMLEGKVEGGVGEAPKGKQWWTAAVTLSNKVQGR